MNDSRLNRPIIIDLPKICDPRGNLTFVEGGAQVPFEIRRAYWIYDVPGGESRGSHAHISSHSLIVAASGSFDVELDDGQKVSRFSLNRSYMGLYVPPGYWRTLDNFSSGSVCMVLTSTDFSEADYVRDYDLFLKMKADHAL